MPPLDSARASDRATLSSAQSQQGGTPTANADGELEFANQRWVPYAALADAQHREQLILTRLAHELRNPLAPMHNAVSILKASPTGTHLPWALGVMERQLGLLTRLIDELAAAKSVDALAAGLTAHEPRAANVLTASASPPPSAIASTLTATVNTPDAALRILLVDDGPDAVSTMAALLEMRGMLVRTAFDGVTALCIAPEFRPDAIVLDIELPDLSGTDVCRRIKTEPWSARSAVIALTGRQAATADDESGSRLFDAHVTKPVNPDTIIRIIHETLATVRDRNQTPAH
jgi:CheY-like chemotaxis protein